MHILTLPEPTLIGIFEYLTYEEVAKKRLICRKVDSICQHILNCGFNKVVKQHAVSLKKIKALLPRRESERRNHCLARHADILTCIETRISMLSMTYSKYMDLKLCCFIPGKVLDEIFRILRLITKTTKALRPHEVLQELRDISSMAIEHFDEKISHSLKKKFVDTNSLMYSSNTGSSVLATSSRNACCDQMRQKVNLLLGLGQSTLESTQCNVHASMQSNTDQSVENPPTKTEERVSMTHLKKIQQEYKKGISKINRVLKVHNNQRRRFNQCLASVSVLNMQIVELKKRLEDVDAKNRELAENIKQLQVESVAISEPSCNTNESSKQSETDRKTPESVKEEIPSGKVGAKRCHLESTEDDVSLKVAKTE